MSDAPANTTSALRRPSTSSETSSLSSASTASTAYTTYSYTKEGQPLLDIHERKAKRGLRQKARDMVHDMGNPPTARQDAKDGKETLNHAPLGGMIGEPMMRPGKI
ncbi:uncharacterized protein TrAtP1_003571 [Trichoderma atroviride]|uniref:Uncharacterized protein n=1 Tax=Hypocrea atroviridis (strain ATCC 20476 / IMI 206040) TaxID=452589 RepID=G9NWE0_HYPAI|nr:uncharacterized protein TRIATDRAFT_299974 [Trichoderma atroviride IMI 206040]EHK45300.1 hypothetical protein TRIATDRAFT_299974 [Trichoderma atroviride IMI 206040]UKZ62320.1 hypothetical protein TrAtP1_003571 [Trichoderma atroviride]